MAYEPNPAEVKQAVLELLQLYALDPVEVSQQAILNKVAWTLRENGWGLYGDSDRHLVNPGQGLLYEIGVRDGALAITEVEGVHDQPWIAPTDPAVFGAHSPQTPLGFLKTKVNAQEQPVPMTTDEHLAAIDAKLDHVIGLFETLAHILDQLHARLDQQYTGEMRVMGRKTTVTLTPVPPKS